MSTNGGGLMDSNLEFERALLQTLSKYAQVHTIKIADDEMSKFMVQEIREHEHMMIFINKLSESNNHMKLQQKKEYIKVYGKAAQIFEESLIPYLQKILNILLKKAKEGTTDLNGVISDSLGMITLHIVHKEEDLESQLELL